MEIMCFDMYSKKNEVSFISFICEAWNIFFIFLNFYENEKRNKAVIKFPLHVMNNCTERLIDELLHK